MEKKNLDWENLGFGYMTTEYRYVADYKDGEWKKGTLTADPTVQINECAGILQYCQEVFEGLKAYTTEDGHIVTFRPDLNARRMEDSAKRLEMPPFFRGAGRGGKGKRRMGPALRERGNALCASVYVRKLSGHRRKAC